MQACAHELSLPVENLISPELVRRICWRVEEFVCDGSDQVKIAELLAELGARKWQIELTAPLLAAALTEREPLALPESESADSAGE